MEAERTRSCWLTGTGRTMRPIRATGLPERDGRTLSSSRYLASYRKYLEMPQVHHRLTWISNLGTTMVAPGIESVMAEFNVDSSTVSSLAVTIFLLGLALGPMFLASLSEFFGRLPVYHVANIVFVAFMVGNALSTNMAGFMIFRFLSGCAGGMPLNLGGGTIADVTLPADRGLATALFSLGPLAGPVSRHCMQAFRH